MNENSNTVWRKETWNLNIPFNFIDTYWYLIIFSWKTEYQHKSVKIYWKGKLCDKQPDIECKELEMSSSGAGSDKLPHRVRRLGLGHIKGKILDVWTRGRICAWRVVQTSKVWNCPVCNFVSKPESLLTQINNNHINTCELWTFRDLGWHSWRENRTHTMKCCAPTRMPFLTPN